MKKVRRKGKGRKTGYEARSRVSCRRGARVVAMLLSLARRVLSQGWDSRRLHVMMMMMMTMMKPSSEQDGSDGTR